MAGRTYKEIIVHDIELYNKIKEECPNAGIAWEHFSKAYIDPDSYPIVDSEYKTMGKIKCTADGLLSIRRIHEFEGFEEQFIKTFESSRMNPVFFFPCERGGINQSRAALLEDRIDHTLLDLKNYCENYHNKTGKECKLYKAYLRPKTKEWLKDIGFSFERIVEDLGIQGSFVGDDYEVFDLEQKENTELSKLKDKYIGIRSAGYMTCWNKDYYENVKKAISKYCYNMAKIR